MRCQLFVMALKPKEEIGAEVRTRDPLFRVGEGAGEAVLDGVRGGHSSGLRGRRAGRPNHNIINTGHIDD